MRISILTSYEGISAIVLSRIVGRLYQGAHKTPITHLRTTKTWSGYMQRAAIKLARSWKKPAVGRPL